MVRGHDLAIGVQMAIYSPCFLSTYRNAFEPSKIGLDESGDECAIPHVRASHKEMTGH